MFPSIRHDARILGLGACGLLLLFPARLQAGPPQSGPVWAVESDAYFSNFGFTLDFAGDVNGDDFEDVLIGAGDLTSDNTEEGAAFLYRGSATGASSSPSWSVLGGQDFAALGYCVSAAGDVNGDGFDDVIVGVPGFTDDQSGEGQALVFHGSATGLGSSPAWSRDGNQASSKFGHSVAGAGDVDGDGFDDVLVGAFLHDDGQNQEGRVDLFLGSATGLSTSPDWSVQGDVDFLWLGIDVAGAGDLNDDGYDDLLIGAGYGGSNSIGGVHVHYGGPLLPALTPDVVLLGDQDFSNFGSSIDGAGDVDGDGFDDVLVGEAKRDASRGRAWAFLGSSGGLQTSPAWVVDGEQVGSQFGYSVRGAGDVNGDGFDDALVGANVYDGLIGNGQGRAYLFHGSATGLAASAAWTQDGGAALDGFGVCVAGGDANDDGLADLVVGANGYDNGQISEGQVSLWLGEAGLLDCNGNGVEDATDVATGWSPDCDGDGVPDECQALGVAFCFGDGSATPCPCLNPGSTGRGCANGSVAEGVVLAAVGSTSVAADDLVLAAGGSVPGAPGLFFQGNDRLGGGAGIPFGDGLRCVAGGIRRLGVSIADGQGVACSTVSIVTRGLVSPGDTRSYQWWHRDTAGSLCGAGFNVSNGLELDWRP